MRNPNLAVGLGLKRAPGLAESLVMHGEDILKNVQQVPVVSRMNGARSDTTLHVLVAGAVPPNPGELLESAQMQHLLAAAADAYDLVIVDAPPITVVSDAIPLLRTIDGVLLVGRIDKNTRALARRLHSILTSLDAPALGVVVNAMKERGPGLRLWPLRLLHDRPRAGCHRDRRAGRRSGDGDRALRGASGP